MNDETALSRNQAINLKVNEAMKSTFRLELQKTNNKPMLDKEREAILQALFGQVHDAIGTDRFLGLPAEALDQFSVMSLSKNHDTKGILVSLVNSFISAYLTPETSSKAFACLEELEALRGDVKKFRNTKKEHIYI